MGEIIPDLPFYERMPKLSNCCRYCYHLSQISTVAE
jgi:hypothetical protein